jgi:hypothetical protein
MGMVGDTADLSRAEEREVKRDEIESCRWRRCASSMYTIPGNNFNANEKFSLSRHAINNRDKGFMVARETAAIKVSGCFQSVNSVPRSRSETEARTRPPLPTLFPRRLSPLSRISSAMECIYARVSMLHLFAQFAITVLDISRAGNTLLLRPQKYYAGPTS